jgi:hypothetical protein
MLYPGAPNDLMRQAWLTEKNARRADIPYPKAKESPKTTTSLASIV